MLLDDKSDFSGGILFEESMLDGICKKFGDNDRKSDFLVHGKRHRLDIVTDAYVVPDQILENIITQSGQIDAEIGRFDTARFVDLFVDHGYGENTMLDILERYLGLFIDADLKLKAYITYLNVQLVFQAVVNFPELKLARAEAFFELVLEQNVFEIGLDDLFELP